MQQGKSLSRSRNPADADRRQVQQAENLFEDFRGEAPQKLTRVRLPRPKAGLVIGDLDGVLYTTVRDGKQQAYIHEFDEHSRPLLVSSSDGKSLHIIGERYAMTDRGIVDE